MISSTHIITCSLTPAKANEFKHMKVVRPEWLVESAKSGTLLPWQNFIFRSEERALESRTRKAAQKPLSHRPTTELIGPSSTQANQADHLSNDDEITDPATAEQAASIPGYAAYEFNPHAERVMANPEWRAAHTSVASDFIEGYYKNSRLHHLSTWRSELKTLVKEAHDRAEQGLTANSTLMVQGQDFSMRGTELVMKPPSKKGKEKAKDDERIIMHCDFDSFFVSAGLVDRPDLRGKPLVVCHSQGNQGGNLSTSEIASASYEARNFGIKNGMRSFFFHLPLIRSVISGRSVFSKQENCVQRFKQSLTNSKSKLLQLFKRGASYSLEVPGFIVGILYDIDGPCR
jgi:DNA repair protein REV1